jgi:retinol dehydrogenase 12
VVHELDLSSFTSVRKFAEIIRTSEAKIDILINNAECIVQGEIFTEDGLEYQMQTNYFSHFLLTHLLLGSFGNEQFFQLTNNILWILGQMLKTEGSKIINVSSSHHSLCRKLDLSSVNFTRQTTNKKEIEVYCASKLCQILFTKELAHRIKSSGKT